MPSELANALDDEPEARRRFDALSYSAQQRLTLPIENARTPQTRQRRVEAALHALCSPPTHRDRAYQPDTHMSFYGKLAPNRRRDDRVRDGE